MEKVQLKNTPLKVDGLKSDLKRFTVFAAKISVIAVDVVASMIVAAAYVVKGLN